MRKNKKKEIRGNGDKGKVKVNEGKSKGNGGIGKSEEIIRREVEKIRGNEAEEGLGRGNKGRQIT